MVLQIQILVWNRDISHGPAVRTRQLNLLGLIWLRHYDVILERL